MDAPPASDWARMGAALEEGAAALAEREVPVGAVIVGADGRVLARARNRTNASYNATRHAEMVALDALVEAARVGDGPPAARLSGAPLAAALAAALAHATLYVSVEPCIMCADALRRAGLGRVVYGCGNDKFGGAGSVLPVFASGGGVAGVGGGVGSGTPHPTVVAGVRADEAVALLKRFYARANARLLLT